MRGGRWRTAPRDHRAVVPAVPAAARTRRVTQAGGTGGDAPTRHRADSRPDSGGDGDSGVPRLGELSHATDCGSTPAPAPASVAALAPAPAPAPVLGSYV